MYACLFQPPVDDRSACGHAPRASAERDAREASARDSLEPLRSADALSNRAGGGAPAQLEKGGAPRGLENVVPQALRRCREPVPARVVVADGRPVRVTTDRRGFDGGTVVQAAGPWRTSGNWWAGEAGRAGRDERASDLPDPAYLAHPPYPPSFTSWSRDEWDVALSDGAVYRIFKDHETEAWFIDAIVD